MRGHVPSLVGATLALLLSTPGCGHSTPAAPADTPVDTPQANRNPVITSMTVNPLSVLGVTVTQMNATATDADNDPLTYQWSFSGGTATGATTSATLSVLGNVVVTLTVTDGKGGTATDTRTVTVVTMTGTWSLTASRCGNAPEEPAVAVITQTGATITGSVTFSTSWCGGDIARGSVDDIKGTIDAFGVVSAPLIYIDDNNTDFKRFGLKVALDATGHSAAGDFSYWTLGSVFYVVGGSTGTMIRQ